MREVSGMARNIIFTPDDEGKMIPIVEAIIVVSEPQYGLNDDGEIDKFRVTDTFRFGASPKGLRILAKQFGEWADEAETLLKKATEQPT